MRLGKRTIVIAFVLAACTPSPATPTVVEQPEAPHEAVTSESPATQPEAAVPAPTEEPPAPEPSPPPKPTGTLSEAKRQAVEWDRANTGWGEDNVSCAAEGNAFRCDVSSGGRCSTPLTCPGIPGGQCSAGEEDCWQNPNITNPAP